MNTTVDILAHAQNEITRLDHKKMTFEYKQNGVRTIIKRYLFGLNSISLAQAEDYYRQGIFSEFEYNVYLTGWHWLRPRFLRLFRKFIAKNMELTR